MEEAAILEPYELAYSDLITLSSDNLSSSSSVDEIRRLETVSGVVIENLGPGVPGASALRETLLPLARELALLSNDDRKRILKEHGLGSDVPLKNLDRIVSSFAMQLKYGNCWNHSTSIGGNREKVADLDAAGKIGSLDDKFMNLGSSFKELGFCMMHLGLRLARICDRAIGGQELENSLLESCTAKGRLIHYHSCLDKQLLKRGVTKKGSNKGRLKKITSSSDHDCTDNGEKSSELWQQWHYDYGIFTILTSPMFISTCNNGEMSDLKSCERNSPSSHSYLQILAEIHNIVPQLWSRLKNGMTFAEFSQVTTKQYYGGGGLQSNTR